MNHDELVANAREIFEGGTPGEAYSLKDYQRDLYEEGETVATQEDIRAACEELVAEGVLQRISEDAYSITPKRFAEIEQDFEESVLELYKEHLRKQDGKK